MTLELLLMLMLDVNDAIETSVLQALTLVSTWESTFRVNRPLVFSATYLWSSELEHCDKDINNNGRTKQT